MGELPLVLKMFYILNVMIDNVMHLLAFIELCIKNELHFIACELYLSGADF